MVESVTETHNLTKRDIQNPLVINSKMDEATVSPSISRLTEQFENDSNYETTTNWETTTTELPIEEINIKKTHRLSLPIQEITRDQKNYRLFIKMKSRLEKGKLYTIHIEFAGNILNNLVGLYKTSYVDLEGNTK